jgi:hypothetical protein
MKPVNTVCGQISELLNIEAYGTYAYHCASKGNLDHDRFLPSAFQFINPIIRRLSY